MINNRITTKNIVLIAFLAMILFVQEEIFTFLPNIQLTIFLLVLYSKKLGLTMTTLIIMIHVLLDNLVMGSLNLYYVPFMFIGWVIIPIMMNTIFKRIEDSFHLALLGIVFALLYSWIYIIPQTIFYQVHFWAYFMADIIFEILLAASSFISILWLYDPCSEIFDRFL